MQNISGKKPKVCVLGFNNQVGGTRTAYLQLMSMLIEHGHMTGAISISDREEWVPEGLAFHLNIPFGAEKLSVRKAAKLAKTIFRTRVFSPDIFISVGISRSANVIARFLKRRSFTICQDVIFGRDPKEPTFAKAAGLFDAIAPQTPSMEARLRQDGFTGRHLRWLPCFPEIPTHEELAAPGANRPIRIGYFGRIAPHKGIDLLIEAFSAEALSNIAVIDFWGGGDATNYITRVREHRLENAIQFKGPYPSGLGGLELMAGYDCVTLTSTSNEGLPLVLLEAMSCGLPLLVSNIASLPDCCEQNPDAIMIAPTQSGIRDGLRELITGLEHGRFVASRQRAYFESNFAYPVMKQRWLECISSPTVFFAA